MARYLFNADKSKFNLNDYLHQRTVSASVGYGIESGRVVDIVFRRGESSIWNAIPNDEEVIGIIGFNTSSAHTFKQYVCGLRMIGTTEIICSIRNDSDSTWDDDFTLRIQLLTKKKDEQ